LFTESQNALGQKGPLEVVLSNSSSSSRANCLSCINQEVYE